MLARSTGARTQRAKADCPLCAGRMQEGRQADGSSWRRKGYQGEGDFLLFCRWRAKSSARFTYSGHIITQIRRLRHHVSGRTTRTRTRTTLEKTKLEGKWNEKQNSRDRQDRVSCPPLLCGPSVRELVVQPPNRQKRKGVTSLRFPATHLAGLASPTRCTSPAGLCRHGAPPDRPAAGAVPT
jgi:hypothetical protein